MSPDLTTRERIEDLLKKAGRPLTVEEIISSLSLEVTNKEVYEHIAHIAKSVRARSGGKLALFMEPPYCRKCGYVFKELDKPKKPSRCPRCKSEWIASPRFIISEAD